MSCHGSDESMSAECLMAASPRLLSARGQGRGGVIHWVCEGCMSESIC